MSKQCVCACVCVCVGVKRGNECCSRCFDLVNANVNVILVSYINNNNKLKFSTWKDGAVVCFVHDKWLLMERAADAALTSSMLALDITFAGYNQLFISTSSFKTYLLSSSIFPSLLAYTIPTNLLYSPCFFLLRRYIYLTQRFYIHKSNLIETWRTWLSRQHQHSKLNYTTAERKRPSRCLFSSKKLS